jgi:DNA-binding response OmpR family regulator
MHALIIEAEPLVATRLEMALQEMGYTSFDVVDRENAAVEAAATRCPDLITANEKLASGSGVTAVQRICEHIAVPVIFIVSEPPRRELEVPFSIALLKPFDEERLREAVAQVRALADVSAFRSG